MPDGQRLARIHRVRTLQLGLAQADEARARDSLTSETALSQRIAQLASAVAPQPAGAAAVSMAAAAHYRDRLHRSAEAAQDRVRMAEENADRAGAATQSARRDQTAVEKLLDRARIERIRAEMKALEDAPSPANRNRHDPC
jgi:hypothetical protein